MEDLKVKSRYRPRRDSQQQPAGTCVGGGLGQGQVQNNPGIIVTREKMQELWEQWGNSHTPPAEGLHTEMPHTQGL